MTITQHNLDGYGTAPTEWQRVHDMMASDLSQAPGTGGPDRHTTWLTTVNTDGTPHVTTRPFDLVLEGSASRVTDAAETYGATRFEVSP